MPKPRRKRPHPEVVTYLSDIGRKGGQLGKGEKKRRGDSEYYRRLGKAKPEETK